MSGDVESMAGATALRTGFTGQIVSHQPSSRQEKYCRFPWESQRSDLELYPEGQGLTDPIALLH
jgi:hypothetical protein